MTTLLALLLGTRCHVCGRRKRSLLRHYRECRGLAVWHG